ncbi:MAG: aldose epimerase family protein [Planctomycetota bacterium]
MKISEDVFGQTPDGNAIRRFKITNSKGLSVSVMSWGASLLEVVVPDAKGVLANVNSVFDSAKAYAERHPYFGSTVGRYANRVGDGTFSIDGQEYQLTKNLGGNTLHGGQDNFSYQNWEVESVDESAGQVSFVHDSPDGKEGFPGNVTATSTYSWNDENELMMAFEATTDSPTHVNLCNHSYWNLGGMGTGSMLDHVLQMHCDEFLEVNDELIPSGKLLSVEGSPFDFRAPMAIGARNGELPETKGYDHCLVVRGEAGTLRPCAEVFDPASGRVMAVSTTQPGVQLYAAGNLPGNERSAGVAAHEAFCLETQHYPDSPNKPMFPTTLLLPGQTMSEKTVHQFSVKSA